MALKITFSADPGNRVLKRFYGITVYGDLWWNSDLKKWTSGDIVSHGSFSSHAPCRSYKAFLRHLRKHREDLMGFRIKLESWFVGQDILAEYE